jgi:hypothetical protein
MTQNAAWRGRKSVFFILKTNDSEKWGRVFKVSVKHRTLQCGECEEGNDVRIQNGIRK